MAGEWDRAEEEADALAAYTAAEPLGWSEHLIRRARLLARAGRGAADPADRDAARRLVADLEAALQRSAIPALRTAFRLW